MMGRLFSKWGAVAAVVLLVAVEAAAVNYLGRNNYLPEGSEHRTEEVPATVPVDRGWMAKLITAVTKGHPGRDRSRFLLHLRDRLRSHA